MKDSQKCYVFDAAVNPCASRNWRKHRICKLLRVRTRDFCCTACVNNAMHSDRPPALWQLVNEVGGGGGGVGFSSRKDSTWWPDNKLKCSECSQLNDERWRRCVFPFTLCLYASQQSTSCSGSVLHRNVTIYKHSIWGTYPSFHSIKTNTHSIFRYLTVGYKLYSYLFTMVARKIINKQENLEHLN